MDIARLRQRGEFEWELPATGRMRVPGIVAASYAMPDAHWGYGFPIGGVAAGVGSTGAIRLDARAMEAMLKGGARWWWPRQRRGSVCPTANWPACP